MRLLLRADVDGVGRKGDLVEVADGFGRNYLVPKGLAVAASPGIEAQAEAMRRTRALKEAEDRQAAEEIAARLTDVIIRVPARAGEGGRLFGSVTTSEIAASVGDQAGVEIDRRKMALAEPIKSLGTHTVSVRLHVDVEVPLTVEIIPS